MTPEQFFTKNMKWIALALLLLLAFKSMQSCNRNTTFTITTNKLIHQRDSLINLNNKALDQIKTLNFQLELAKQQVNASNEKAKAVQNAVEKIKSNTTVVVKGAEEVKK